MFKHNWSSVYNRRVVIFAFSECSECAFLSNCSIHSKRILQYVLHFAIKATHEPMDDISAGGRLNDLRLYDWFMLRNFYRANPHISRLNKQITWLFHLTRRNSNLFPGTGYRSSSIFPFDFDFFFIISNILFGNR